MDVTPHQAISALPQRLDFHTSHAQTPSAADKPDSKSAAEHPLPTTPVNSVTSASDLPSNESPAQMSSRSQLQSAVKSQQTRPTPQLLSHSTVDASAQSSSSPVNTLPPKQGTVSVLQNSPSTAPQPASCTPAPSPKQPQICANFEAAATPGPTPTIALISSAQPIPAPASAKTQKVGQAASSIFSFQPKHQNQQQHFPSTTAHSSDAPNSYPTEAGKQVCTMVDDLSELELDPDPATEVSADKPSLLCNVSAGIESPPAGQKRSSSQVPVDTTASFATTKKPKAGISSACTVATSSNSTQPTTSVAVFLTQAKLQQNTAQTADPSSRTDTLLISRCPEQPSAQGLALCLPAKQNGPPTTSASLTVSCQMRAACSNAAAPTSSTISSKHGRCQPAFALLSTSVVTLHTNPGNARPSIRPMRNNSSLPKQVSGAYKPVIEELPCETQPPDTNAKAAADSLASAKHAMIIDIDSDSDHADHSQLAPPREAQQADSKEVQQLQDRIAEVRPEPAVQLAFASDEDKALQGQQMPKQAKVTALMSNDQGRPLASVQARSQPSVSLGIADIFSSFSALEDLSDADEEEERTKPTVPVPTMAGEKSVPPAGGTCTSSECWMILFLV